MQFTTHKSPKQKRIALVAHDHMKNALSDWCNRHRADLAEHQLFATGTTASKISKDTGMKVDAFLSGPMGGDQQIGARIAEQTLDMLIFFWDPLASMPHDPDVKALLRIAAVWNVPVACNPSSADYLLSSPLIHQEFEYQIPDYNAYASNRQ